jgi:hypothetical protein
MQTGSAITGATVRILDGPHTGRTATSAGDGSYAIADVAGNMNVSVRADGYRELQTGFAVVDNTQQNFRLSLIPASECATIVGKSWKSGSTTGRTDFVDVRYIIRNTCQKRIRFHGSGGTSRLIRVEIYDNLSRSGSPLGDGLFDPFEIAGNTQATIEDLVILDRGSIFDIPGPDAIVMYPEVSFVP